MPTLSKKITHISLSIGLAFTLSLGACTQSPDGMINPSPKKIQTSISPKLPQYKVATVTPGVILARSKNELHDILKHEEQNRVDNDFKIKNIGNLEPDNLTIEKIPDTGNSGYNIRFNSNARITRVVIANNTDLPFEVYVYLSFDEPMPKPIELMIYDSELNLSDGNHSVLAQGIQIALADSVYHPYACISIPDLAVYPSINKIDYFQVPFFSPGSQSYLELSTAKTCSVTASTVVETHFVTPNPEPTPNPDPDLQDCDETTILPSQLDNLGQATENLVFSPVAYSDDFIANYPENENPLQGTLGSNINSINLKETEIRQQIGLLTEGNQYEEETELPSSYEAIQKRITFLEDSFEALIARKSTDGLIHSANTMANALQLYQKLLTQLNAGDFEELSPKQILHMLKQLEDMLKEFEGRLNAEKNYLNEMALEEAKKLRAELYHMQELVELALLDVWVQEGMIDPQTGELTPPENLGDFSIQNAKKSFYEYINDIIFHESCIKTRSCEPNPNVQKYNTQIKKSRKKDSTYVGDPVDLITLREAVNQRNTPLEDFLKEHKELYISEGARILSGYDKVGWAAIGAVNRNAIMTGFSELAFAILPEGLVDFLPLGKGFRMAEASLPQVKKAIDYFEKLKIKYKKNNPDLVKHLDIIIDYLKERLNNLQKICSPCGAGGKYYSSFRDKSVSINDYIFNKSIKDLEGFLRKYGHLKDYSVKFDKKAIPDFSDLRKWNGSQYVPVSAAERKLFVKNADFKIKITPSTKSDNDQARKEDKLRAFNALKDNPAFTQEMGQLYPGKNITDTLLTKHFKGYYGHHAKMNTDGSVDFQFVRQDLHSAFLHDGSFSLSR